MVRKVKLKPEVDDNTDVDTLDNAMTSETEEPQANNEESEEVTQQSDEDDLANVSEDEHLAAQAREKRTFLKEVAKIGERYGLGKVSMIELAEATTEVAASKTIGLADAAEIYKRFKDRANAKATLDDNALPVPEVATVENTGKFDEDDSTKQQVSKVRSFIKIGNIYERDGIDLVRRARNVHLKMLASGQDRKTIKSGSTYTILVAVAGQHVGDDKNPRVTPMSDDEIEAYLTIDPTTKAAPTALDKLMQALNATQAAQKGSDHRAPADGDWVNTALDALRQSIAEQDGGADLLAKEEAKTQARLDKQAKH